MFYRTGCFLMTSPNKVVSGRDFFFKNSVLALSIFIFADNIRSNAQFGDKIRRRQFAAVRGLDHGELCQGRFWLSPGTKLRLNGLFTLHDTSLLHHFHLTVRWLYWWWHLVDIDLYTSPQTDTLHIVSWYTQKVLFLCQMLSQFVSADSYQHRRSSHFIFDFPKLN